VIGSNCVQLEVSLCAPQDKVWDALTEAASFGTWFGIAWEPGTTFRSRTEVVGQLAPTKVHPGIARRRATSECL
jgi:uncharacterized protein YndB with AHSA1/START domain